MRLIKRFVLFLLLILIIVSTSVLAQTVEETFVNRIGEEAKNVCRDSDLYASVLIAQAAIESNFGRSGLSTPPINNLFGIKGAYNGQCVLVDTKEDDGAGNLYNIKAAFKKYPSTRASITDYVKLLSEYSNGFYSGAKKSVTNGDYRRATSFLTGRYATDTSYHNKLNYIISRYDLTRFDLNPVESIEPMEIASITPAEINNNYIEVCDDLVYMYEDALFKDRTDAVLFSMIKKGIEPEEIETEYDYMFAYGE